MTNTEKLLELIKENPDLPVIPIVDSEVVADDCCSWWLASFGDVQVDEYCIGNEHVHFKSDDEEDVLGDLPGCKYYKTPDGRDILELNDDEWKELYNSQDWKRAIIVHISLPD